MMPFWGLPDYDGLKPGLKIAKYQAVNFHHFLGHFSRRHIDVFHRKYGMPFNANFLLTPQETIGMKY